MFSKLLCIVNKSSYEKEQLKLHQSLLGVKGGGGKNSPLSYMQISKSEKKFLAPPPCQFLGTPLYIYGILTCVKVICMRDIGL